MLPLSLSLRGDNLNFTQYSRFLVHVNRRSYTQGMAKIRPYNQDCPIARTLDIVGDRWTLLIVRDLFIGHTRFNEFLKSSPGIPPKILSGRLKKLQEHGIIERRVYSEHPLRAEYTLTETGRSLRPVLHTIGEWGFEHLFEGEDELRDQVREVAAAQAPEFDRT